MKIIDQTPFLDEKGQLGFAQRIQGMMKFGFNWLNELQAQKAIITYFDRQLEKGYTLIHNVTLGQSGIMVPIVLLGPTGIYVIQISLLKGRYEVKGDSWSVAEGEGYKPAPDNVIRSTIRMANAVKAFVERQGVKMPVDPEPVLIAGDPGLHVESVRPAIKVLMIDGIKSYVAGLATARQVLSTESIFEISERIVNPRPPRKAAPAPIVPSPVPQEHTFEESSQQDASRARAIFNASQDAKPFAPADFDFAMDEEPSLDVPSSETKTNIQESSPAQPLPRPKPRGRRILGMTPGQLAFIAGLALLLLCTLAGLAYYIFVLS